MKPLENFSQAQSSFRALVTQRAVRVLALVVCQPVSLYIVRMVPLPSWKQT